MSADAAFEIALFIRKHEDDLNDPTKIITTLKSLDNMWMQLFACNMSISYMISLINAKYPLRRYPDGFHVSNDGQPISDLMRTFLLHHEIHIEKRGEEEGFFLKHRVA